MQTALEQQPQTEAPIKLSEAPAKLSQIGTFKVYKAISLAMAEIAQTGIQKNNRNKQQGWNFRGIDDVYNLISRIIPKHDLVIMFDVLGRKVVERPTKNGGVQSYVTLKVRYDFISTEDGSKHSVTVYGEAMDSGDKATSKAMSAAYKYACFQVFCIPTEGDNDADNNTHEFVQDGYHQPRQNHQQQQNQIHQNFQQPHQNPAPAPRMEQSPQFNDYYDQSYQYEQARVPVVDRSQQNKQTQDLQAVADSITKSFSKKRQQESHRVKEQAQQQNRQQEQGYIPPQGHPEEVREDYNLANAREPAITPRQFQAVRQILTDLNMSDAHLCRIACVDRIGNIKSSEFERVMEWLSRVQQSRARPQQG